MAPQLHFGLRSWNIYIVDHAISRLAHNFLLPELPILYEILYDKISDMVRIGPGFDIVNTLPYLAKKALPHHSPNFDLLLCGYILCLVLLQLCIYCQWCHRGNDPPAVQCHYPEREDSVKLAG